MNGYALVGVDFPIGLPASYARLVGGMAFKPFLSELGQGIMMRHSLNPEFPDKHPSISMQFSDPSWKLLYDGRLWFTSLMGGHSFPLADNSPNHRFCSLHAI